MADLKSDPSLIPNAVNEVIRFESPLRAFARHTRVETDVAGVRSPGRAVLVVYASANRDEREWENPDYVRHPPRRQPPSRIWPGRACVRRPEPGAAGDLGNAARTRGPRRPDRAAAKPTWAINNIIHRHDQLPLELVPA